jgi:CheY-like chemotaxis protein
MDVWFVDDRRANREAWLASFPAAVREACSLRVFGGVPELFAALDGGERPDVLFVDYFLGCHVGVEVIERLTSDGGPVPLLVAHSSVPRANAGMLRAGAHLAMEKVHGASVTRSIQEAIRTPEDLKRLVRAHCGG